MEVMNRKGDMVYSQNIEYANYSDYKTFKSGYYHLKVYSKEQLLLNKELAIGKKDHFTIAVHGIIPSHPKINEKILETKLLEVFEGAVEESNNGSLPKISVFLDFFEDKPEKAQLKVTHFCPGFTSFETYLKKDGKWSKLTTLKYPVRSKSKTFKAGEYEIEVRHSSSGIVLTKGNITLRPSVLTTVCVIGMPDRYPYELKMITMDSKKFE